MTGKVFLQESRQERVNGMDYNPARLLCPWDFPGKNTRVAISFSRGPS